MSTVNLVDNVDLNFGSGNPNNVLVLVGGNVVPHAGATAQNAIDNASATDLYGNHAYYDGWVYNKHPNTNNPYGIILLPLAVMTTLSSGLYGKKQRGAVTIIEGTNAVGISLSITPSPADPLLPYFVVTNPQNDFDITASDDDGGQNLRVFKGTAKSFTDLPNQCEDGFRIQVAGDNNKKEDNFYVVFSGSGGSGVWKESVAANLENNFNLSTMPHTLKQKVNSNDDLYFEFTQGQDNDGQSWRSRVAGDEDTNTDPSFVGNTINDIFFHRNRLGIISGENVIFSETSNFFNFYRTTVRALLDSDPIDVAVSQNEVSELKAALPIQDSLLLFSELNQFTLSASQLLTPAEVTIDQSTKFECDLRTPPVGAGNSVFFNTVGGNFAGVREYYTDGETEIKDATLITSHVPEYLSGNVRKMAASTNEDMLICLTSAVKSEAYVYKWYNSNNERLQSSWSKWTFDKNVADITFNNSDLYITFEDGSYEKITLRNPVKDITYSEARVLSAGVGTVGGVSQINFTPYQITLGIPADPNILGSMVTWVSYFAYAITGLCTLTLDTRVLRFTYKETGEKVTAFILNGVTYEVSNATSVDEAGGNYFFTLPQSEVDALNGQSFQPTVVTGSTDVVIFNTKSHDVLLDHRTKIQLADGTSSYSTSSIPYTATSNTVFVDHSGRIIAKGTGDLQKVVDFLFEGNAPKQHLENGAAVNNYVYAGEPYTFKYQLSEQVFTPTDGDTTKLGRFQLRSMAFNFNDTGTFNVAVKSTGRDTVNHRFTGRLLGDSNNFLGYSAIVDDETFKVGVQSQAKETDITITNDTHLPCVFQSAEYEAWATLRNRRL